MSPKLLYPDLSYKIVGILYNVYNELGSGYQEKYYQKAIAILFQKEEVKFREQLKVDLHFDNQKIGKYYLDFLVKDKIVLEIKVGEFFHKKDFEQIKAYLKAKNLELGIIALFAKDGVKTQRILNRIKNIRINSD